MPNAAPSTPITMTRRGARPSARPSSSASGHRERVRRGETEVAGQRPPAGVDPVNGARRRARRHSVHDHDQVEPRPGVEQPRRLVVALEHGRTGGPQAVGHERPHRVVTPVAAPEAGGRLQGHVRSTSSLRKWVAQEMHGS